MAIKVPEHLLKDVVQEFNDYIDDAENTISPMYCLEDIVKNAIEVGYDLAKKDNELKELLNNFLDTYGIPRFYLGAPVITREGIDGIVVGVILDSPTSEPVYHLLKRNKETVYGIKESRLSLVEFAK